MAQQTINVGASPNDGTGTPLRTAFQYTNSNFSELYTAVGPSGNNIVVPGSATITGDLTVDTNVMKVDSVNNRVGVNTATPRVSLDVASGNAYVSGQFDFGGTGPSAAQGFLSYTGGNAIVGTYGNTSLLFYSNGSEQMRLNSTGLGVGASPATGVKLDVNGFVRGTSGAVFQGANNISSGAGLELGYSTGSQYGFLQSFDRSGAAYKPIRLIGSSIDFDIANSVKMTLDSSGNVGIGVTPSAGGGCLQLSSGITFPATQVASSDANTLDDYEEGNWTPTVGDASSGGNQATTATAVGRYTKIGRLVTVQWEVTDINTTGLTAGNAVYIRGLPFASSSATTQFGTPAVSGVTFSGYLTAGVFSGSSFPIYSSSSGGSLADIKVSALASGTADIWGTLTYIV